MTTTESPPTPVHGRRPSTGSAYWLELLRSYPWLPAAITSVVLLVVGQVIAPGYASWGNINQILASAAILALASCGQTIVMVAGDFGIDLSVGQLMSFTAVLGFILMGHGPVTVVLGLLVVLAAGAAFGVLNGSLVAFARLPALVVTLGTLVIAQGGIQSFTSAGTPAGGIPGFLSALTTGSVLGVRYVTVLVLVLVGALAFALARSGFGRNLYLIGSNREAARLSGINVRRTVVLAFVVAGVCGAVAGLLLLSYAGTANLSLGDDYLLLSITASVIGGASLAGGEGSVVSSSIGAVALQVITTFLLTVGVSDAVRQAITGLLLLAMLLLNTRTARLRQ